MPQTFLALRCFACGVFQVHFEKKTNKWCCKLCNEKQSIRKVYARGFTGDCRAVVQDLNLRRVAGETLPPDADEISYDEWAPKQEPNDMPTPPPQEQPSKWAAFLPPQQQNDGHVEEPDARYVTTRAELKPSSRKQPPPKQECKSKRDADDEGITPVYRQLPPVCDDSAAPPPAKRHREDPASAAATTATATATAAGSGRWARFL